MPAKEEQKGLFHLCPLENKNLTTINVLFSPRKSIVLVLTLMVQLIVYIYKAVLEILTQFHIMKWISLYCQCHLKFKKSVNVHGA